MTSPRPSQGGQQWGIRLAELAILASATLAFLSVLGIRRETLVIVGIPLILATVAVVLVMRRLYSTTVVPVSIAIGGASGIGKTVFINVLCNQLMEGGSDTLSFTPEPQTAQYVYRNNRNLNRGEWPLQTTGDHIDHYRGTVVRTKRSPIGVLFNGRQEFKVEFGDAAGENWNRLADEAALRANIRRDDSAAVPRLIESTFFSYVAEADSLFYLIDAVQLTSSPFMISESVDDLLSTVTLLRTIQGRGPTAPLDRPIPVIFSKVDALDPREIEVLVRVLIDGEKEDLRSYGNLGKNLQESISHLIRLKEVLDRQAASYSFFLVSAIAEASRITTQPWGSERYPLYLSRFSVEAPVDWAFEDLWRRRRFISGGHTSW